MTEARDYLQEVQKFTSSQYWYSGLRITAGVMLPVFVFIGQGWLSFAVPFLWGALFVSLTDTPGPIHHRRNGIAAAILLNTAVVLLTILTKEYQPLLITQIVVLSFFLTMFGAYGTRAGAVGSLALVVMLLNLLSLNQAYSSIQATALIFGGGVWYMGFSMLLHGIRPYRAVEQALGEHLIVIADYVQARAGFYREGIDLTQCFHRLMKAQSDVQNIQEQAQEMLFKTRRLVADASPRSRSLMMIYLESLDLFEQTMFSYHDYQYLHKQLANLGLLNRYYGLILELAAGLEYIGITVQMGKPVRNQFDINRRIAELRELTERQLADDKAGVAEALSKILNNVQEIANRMNRLILYTRMEGKIEDSFEVASKTSRLAVSQPIKLSLLISNLTLRSESFRHAIRLTVAMILGYGVSVAFSLTHSYWLLLTIVTILRPAYVTTKRRNVQRVAGTLIGVVIVSVLLLLISNGTLLLALLVVSMLLGYSLLRVHYLAFVVFLTIFLVISLHFLNPLQFQALIVERLVDTAIGSVIAFLVSRFIFPVWGHSEIWQSMQRMLDANRQYFSQAWLAVTTGQSDTPAYDLARQSAVVALTNLSNNFQTVLSEPQQPPEASAIHQFVIANHMLTGHIAALSDETLGQDRAEAEELSRAISYELQCAYDNLRDRRSRTDLDPAPGVPPSIQTLTQLSIILALARDVRKISAKLSEKAEQPPQAVPVPGST